MFQSRLTLFLLLLFIVSCKPGTKTGSTEIKKPVVNESTDQQTKIEEAPKNYSVKKSKINIKPVRKEKAVASNSLLFDKAPQSFTIAQDRDTTLSGIEGTMIKIQKRSFVFEDDNNEPSQVIINVKEFYKIDDIIFANLTTRSGNNILETGGMIFIEAVSENRKCKLKDDASFEISFPYETKKDSMELFTGDLKNGRIDWITTQPTLRNFVINSEKPEFPGGLARMQQFLNDNIEYPDSIAEKGHIRLTVNFTLDSLGNVLSATINDSPFKSLNQVVLNAFFKMPKWKPAKMDGRSIRVFLKQQVIFYSSLALESTENSFYKLKFEETINDSNINEIEIVELKRYIFSCSKLGWINCDRFYKIETPKTDLFVKAENYPDADVKIIFHGFNGILEGERTSLGYVFKGVPSGEKITVLALAKQNDKNFISLTESSTSSTINELTFEQVTMDVLKQKLAQLNDLRK